MDWITGIQNAIDYMEAHITEELDKQIRAHPLLVDHCKISAGMKSQMGNTGALLTPRGINKPNHKNQEKGRSRPKGLPNPSAVFCDLTAPEKLSTTAGKDSMIGVENPVKPTIFSRFRSALKSHLKRMRFVSVIKFSRLYSTRIWSKCSCSTRSESGCL